MARTAGPSLVSGHKTHQIRDLSLTVYLLYCALTECSILQGTIGKRLLGLRVTDNYGQKLTIGRSFVRNRCQDHLLSAIGTWLLVGDMVQKEARMA